MSDALVSSVHRMHGIAGISLREDTSLEDTIRTMAENPTLLAVFLVDSQNRYISMVSRGDLVKWAHLNITGGKGSNMPISEFYRIIDARKAKDLASPFLKSLALKESDTLQKALHLMAEYEIDTLPVLDENRKIIGDLRLSEALYWVITYGRKLGNG